VRLSPQIRKLLHDDGSLEAVGLRFADGIRDPEIEELLHRWTFCVGKEGPTLSGMGDA
jgi:hypothetical protein